MLETELIEVSLWNVKSAQEFNDLLLFTISGPVEWCAPVAAAGGLRMKVMSALAAAAPGFCGHIGADVHKICTHAGAAVQRGIVQRRGLAGQV
jgi:hypothetical protein